MISRFALYKAIQYGHNNGWRILVAACFLICACAPALIAQAEPNWYKKPPNDDKYYYGVGMSTESMDDAENKAYADLCRKIGIKMSVQEVYRFHSSKTGKNEIISRDYSGSTRIIAEYDLQEVEISARLPRRQGQETEYYALAHLSREKYGNYVQEQWDRLRTMVAYGDSSIATSDVVTALKEYSEAWKVAKTLPFRDRDSLKSLSDVDIQHKITDIKKALKVKAIYGNNQNGKYGDSLAVPLRVQVKYQNSPLEAFPLWATYTRGTGQLVNPDGATGQEVLTYTDANGQAIFKVAAIESLSDKNIIQVEAKDLPVSIGVDFHYSSFFSSHTAEGPVIHLNDSANEQTLIFEEGDKVKTKIHVPQKCYLNLFVIFANGRLKHQQSFEIQDNDSKRNDSQRKMIRILKEKSGWVVEYVKESSVNAEDGFGLETLLAIATKEEWIPDKGTQAREWVRKRFGENPTPKKLINQLQKDFGQNSWQVGWTSYVVLEDE